MVMTSLSLGISLIMEGISYIAAAELPCVIVNIMRGGPGCLGSIQPAQSEYFQSVKGEDMVITICLSSLEWLFRSNDGTGFI